MKILKDGFCELPVVESLTGLCETDIEKFPNDVHKCSFNFYISNVGSANGNIDFEVNKESEVIINGAWSVQRKCVLLLAFREIIPSQIERVEMPYTTSKSLKIFLTELIVG